MKAVRGHLVIGTAAVLGLGVMSTARSSELHAAAAKSSPPVVTIRDVQRTQKWEMAGPFPGTVGFVEAQEGEEILVIRLHVKSDGPVALTGFGLIDGTGKKCDACTTSVLGWEGNVPPTGIAVPFRVPKNTQVRRLTITEPPMELHLPEARQSKR